MSVMAIAKAARLVLGECEGSLACATCHVVVDPAWAPKLEAPSEDEEAMLDTVFDLRPTSGLSCQIRLTPAPDGIRVSLP
jgi:2Fe-2S ferredoxin